MPKKFNNQPAKVSHAQLGDEHLQTLLSQYTKQFEPVGILEKILVERIAHADWRIQNVRASETRAMNDAMRSAPQSNDLDRMLDAFLSLAEQGVIDKTMRYEEQLQRSYDRAVRELLNLKSRRTKAVAKVVAKALPQRTELIN